jgi:hypothetical protein
LMKHSFCAFSSVKSFKITLRCDFATHSEINWKTRVCRRCKHPVRTLIQVRQLIGIQ